MSTMDERMSSVEQLLADIAESNRAMRETDRAMQETDRAMQETNRLMHLGNLAMQEATRAQEAQTRAFREELHEAQRKWGELANKMGTLVEDIVAPGLPTVFRSVFGFERLDAFGQRVRRTHRADPGRQQEFDYVASAGDLVLVNETKSTLRPEDIPAFVAVLNEVRNFLTEADGRSVVGALAGFSVDPSLVNAGERQGLLMFGLGTGLLRVLNTPDFQPRRF